MNVKFKKVVFLLPWMMRFRKINSTARKYRKTPDLIEPVTRSKMIMNYSKKFLKLNNVQLLVEGYENLPDKGGVLLTPNHKSNIDPAAIIAALEYHGEDTSIPFKIPTFIAKKELLKKRIMRNILSVIDTYAIDRENFRESMETLYEFGQFVKTNRTFGIVFPEGTRVDETDELGEFKGGAFKLAQKEFMPIIPVTIKNSRTALDKGRKGKLLVTVIFHKPIKPLTFITQDTKSIATRVKTIVESEL
ncbi:lysophospholipid acyltransferase family protein [Mycoplasma crocodyli]|uniref:Probable 1-acyl-sn-glycerol-3-phosphate acyltransferase n=1 Tax=Mycoplasma crocodyli (strain ATCC 51981 / MP145) TaxID=512564 RepID=D5E5U7_MYCCM|nr:lysophospholipid acyltransferase family protein [Mycoplasma crocodyli]ADE19821.1 probable 1-acyl-sn-glycerol-3-phosphate acyltransferase [Mycoplasma crocodyli MP145]